MRTYIKSFASLLIVTTFSISTMAHSVANPTDDDIKTNMKSTKQKVMSKKDYEKFRTKLNRKTYIKRAHRSNKTCVSTTPKIDDLFKIIKPKR